MDLNKKLEELKPYQLNCNVFDVYSYNGLSMQDLLCQFFTKINECITVSNETIDLAKWLVNEGLEIEVVKKLMIWLEDGTLENIINVNLFNTLNEKISGLSSQLKHIQNKYLSNYVDTDVDCISILNELIQSTSLNGGGVIIVDDIFLVNPNINNHIIPRSNVTIRALAAKVHGFKVVDNIGSYDYLIKDSGYYKNFNLIGLNFDMNYIRNNENSVVSHKIENTNQTTFFVGQGDNVKVENCKFISCGVNVIATQSTTKNITIENNEFFWDKHLFSEWYDNSIIYVECESYSINNNYLYTSSEHANGGIEVHGGKSSICNANKIIGFSTGINVTSPRSAINDNSYSQMITNNNIFNCEIGVRLWNIENTNLNNIMINNNIIKINQVERNNKSWIMGIGIQLHPKGEYNINNLSINSNIIEFEEDKMQIYSNIDMCGAISLRTYGSVVSDVNISSNIIKNSPVQVFNLMGYGINDTTFKNINIINNNISNFGSLNINEKYNSCFVYNFATYDNVVIKNNLLETNKATFSSLFDEHIKLVNCDVVDTNNTIKGDLVVYPYTKNKINECLIKNESSKMFFINSETPTQGYYRYGDLIVNSEAKLLICKTSGRINDNITINFTCDGSNEVITNNVGDIKINDCFYHSSNGTFEVKRINGNKLYLNRPVYHNGILNMQMVNPVFELV